MEIAASPVSTNYVAPQDVETNPEAAGVAGQQNAPEQSAAADTCPAPPPDGSPAPRSQSLPPDSAVPANIALQLKQSPGGGSSASGPIPESSPPASAPKQAPTPMPKPQPQPQPPASQPKSPGPQPQPLAPPPKSPSPQPQPPGPPPKSPSPQQQPPGPLPQPPRQGNAPVWPSIVTAGVTTAVDIAGKVTREIGTTKILASGRYAPRGANGRFVPTNGGDPAVKISSLTGKVNYGMSSPNPGSYVSKPGMQSGLAQGAKLAKVGDVLGKANVALAVAGVGLDVYNQWQADSKAGVSTEDKVGNAVGTAAVGAGGIVASIAVGAAIGTAIPVPIVGTVVGAVVGGVVGCAISVGLGDAARTAGREVVHGISNVARAIGDWFH